MSYRNPLHLEPLPQLDEFRVSLRRNRTSEVEEDLESGGARLVEELKTACGGAVHVTGLFDSERSAQLCPPSVHVKRFGLHVEELARRAEAAELPVHFNRRSAVGHQHPHRAKSLEALDQLLPPANA
jgi:hypothetical protein